MAPISIGATKEDLHKNNMGYYIPDPYNLKQDHILSEILEDQIQKLLNEDAKKAKSINGLNGKSKVASKKKETK